MLPTLLGFSIFLVTVKALEFQGIITAQEQIQSQTKTDSDGNIIKSEGFVIDRCDKINLLENSYGQIRSPSRAGKSPSYPENINCAWYIKIQPESILTLSFSMFDLEEGKHLRCTQKPCCGDTWLSILSIPSQFGLASFSPFKTQDNINFLYCGKSLSLPPLMFSGSGIVITFKTGEKISGGKGFVLDYTMDKPVRKQCDEGQYHCRNGKCIPKNWLCNQWDECGDSSDEKNCTVSCKAGYSHCSSNSSHCYDFVRGRCDGVLDCPGGEDEQACALNCGDQLACRTTHGHIIGCYKSSQRCDSVRDCPDGSDEENCDPFLCGPHRNGGFLCRNRRCIPFLNRCDGVQDCGDFSDEETCMKMSVITAVILGSLICGLLLIIAAGCGLRLYHLRTALERRWSTIRLQQTRTIYQDVDEFGQRRPVMGRLPPPSYAQAIGAVHLSDSAPTSISAQPHSQHRHRRHSGRGPRRPAPPLPDPPALAPLRSSSAISSPPSLSVQQLPEESPPPAINSAVDTDEPEEGSVGLWARIVNQWRKQMRQHLPGRTEETADSPTQQSQLESPPLTARSSGVHIVDTEPLLIESQP